MPTNNSKSDNFNSTSARRLGFHFGTTTQNRPAETAYLSTLETQFKNISKAPEVIVLVSPSSIDHMKRTYARMRNVKVYPLQLAPSDLNSSRIVSLMGLDEGKVILHMDSILAVLRAQGLDNFNCKKISRAGKFSLFVAD